MYQNVLILKKEPFICYELVAVLVGGIVFPSNGLFLLIVGLIVMHLAVNQRVNVYIYTASWVFPVIAILGIVMNLYSYSSVDGHSLIRFLLYIFSPVVLLYYGSVLSRTYTIKSCLRAVFLSGGICGLLFMLYLGYTLIVNGFSFDSFRTAKILSSETAVVSFFLFVFYNRSGWLFTRNTNRIIVALSLISVFMGFSRSALLFFLVGMMVYFINKPVMFGRSVKTALIIVLCALLLLALLCTNSAFEESVKAYGARLFFSWQEISAQNEWDFPTINAYWRGFEAYSFQQQFQTTNILQKLFGQGFQGVNVGEYAALVTDSNSTYIPYLHNGYLTVLTWSGIFGLILYLYFYISNYRFARRVDMQKRNPISTLLKITLAAAAVNTLFVMGITSIGMALIPCILIGLFVNTLRDERKKTG